MSDDQTRIYDNEADSRGPMYITIGDGGNREGLALKYACHWLAPYMHRVN